MEEGLLVQTPQYWQQLSRKGLVASEKWGDVRLTGNKFPVTLLDMGVPNSFLCRTCRFVLTPLPKSEKE